MSAIPERALASSVPRTPFDRVKAALERIGPLKNVRPSVFEGTCPIHGPAVGPLTVTVHADTSVSFECVLDCPPIAITIALDLTVGDLEPRAVPLVLVIDADPELPAFSELATQQVGAAQSLLHRDLGAAPEWALIDVARVVGPMLPGDLVVVGARMGNGKSALLMTQMDAFASARIATLYIPLEIDPEINRFRWAAWRLGLDVTAAIRQDWARLPEGARESIDLTLQEQEQNPFVHFASDRRMTFATLAGWCRRARDEIGIRVVMLDHVHRMDFGADARQHRVAVTEVARRLKDLARELGIVMIAAAQLNRRDDPLDPYTVPTLDRLKESAGLAEEADVVLMLSRRLRRELPEKWLQRLKAQQISERDIEDPGVMAITCRKHRLDNEALNRTVTVVVANGRVQDRARSWHNEQYWEPQ